MGLGYIPGQSIAVEGDAQGILHSLRSTHNCSSHPLLRDARLLCCCFACVYVHYTWKENMHVDYMVSEDAMLDIKDVAR